MVPGQEPNICLLFLAVLNPCAVHAGSMQFNGEQMTTGTPFVVLIDPDGLQHRKDRIQMSTA